MGRKFIPKARALSMTDVLGACSRLNYRMVRTFERFVRRAEHKWRDALRKEVGFNHGPVSNTHQLRTIAELTCSGSSDAWMRMGHGGNQSLSPFFGRFIRTME
jgi:hypothetical protein